MAKIWYVQKAPSFGCPSAKPEFKKINVVESGQLVNNEIPEFIVNPAALLRQIIIV